mmetsp:Transcript_88716/g.237294  ORF Transcript_88716/g.237294 Transcript_88716/m.237294 type:complete len:756 (+) Transcript_88716:74-2341(+)
MGGTAETVQPWVSRARNVVKFFELRFEDPELERRFVELRMSQIRRVAVVMAVLCPLIPASLIPSTLELDPEYDTRGMRVLFLSLAVVLGMCSSSIFLLSRESWFVRCFIGSAEGQEWVACVFAVVPLLGTMMNPYRASRIVGEDPHIVWGADQEFSDSNSLLMLAIFTSGVPNLFPVRFCNAWYVAFLPAIYVVLAALTGSPEPQLAQQYNSVVLIVLCIIALVSFVRSERLARERFLTLDGTVVRLKQAEEQVARETRYREGCMAIMKATHSIVMKVDDQGIILEGAEQLNSLVAGRVDSVYSAVATREESVRLRSHLQLLQSSIGDASRLAQRLDLRLAGSTGVIEAKLCSVGLAADAILIGINCEDSEVIQPMPAGVAEVRRVEPRRPGVMSSVASTAVTYKTGKSQLMPPGIVVPAEVKVLTECGVAVSLIFKVATRCAQYAREVKEEAALWKWGALVVKPDEFVLSHTVLGAGSFGSVTAAELRGVQVATKVWREVHAHDVRREIALLALLARDPHPNVCRVLGIVERPELRIFMELCHGPLGPWLMRDKLGEAQKMAAMTQICSALCHMHSLSVAHLDLKSDNVLIVGAVEQHQLPWVKVADVGLGLWRSQRLNEDMTTATAFDGVQTQPWRAPEYKAGAASPAVDIFAFGALMVEAAVGRRITDSVLQLVQGKDMGSSALPTSPVAGRAPLPELGLLVRAMCEEAPEERPLATEVGARFMLGFSSGLSDFGTWVSVAQSQAPKSVSRA